ncbi:MAG: hypothetical protein ACRDF7_04230 [Candidatus Limnocylindrales bacterium]
MEADEPPEATELEPVELVDDELVDDGPPARPAVLGPFADDGQVSGHRPATGSGSTIAEAPEQNWAAARDRVFPILRPPGTVGADPDVPLDVLRATHAIHTAPLVVPGPAGMVVSFAMQGDGFDILVNGEHLLSWGVGAAQLAAAAGANLASWSAGAGWTDEISGQRRILSSDVGGGHDAARILLAEVREHLARELTAGAAPGTRVLIGLPERHLLLAGALAPGDDEFGALFHDFVAEHAQDADEPIDPRVFELVAGELAWYAG